MSASTRSTADPENAELRERLAEAESVLQAIRRGEVDAVVVSGGHGEQVFTLQGADHPYRVLVESMNEGAATLDADGTILYGNPKLASLIGVSMAQLRGTPLVRWLVPDDADRFPELVRRAAGHAASAELSLLGSDGTAVPVQMSLSPFVLDERRYRCAIVTDLRLAKHHAALERTARQINEANDRLRQADLRKDEFLATLAHELRNPLAPIRAAAHAIRRLEDNDERLDHAYAMIERQTAHMARLVDDLLELSRAAQGKIDLQRRPESLAGIIASVAEAAQSSLKTGQDLTVDVGDGPMQVDADSMRLAQAIGNVLDNAIKYTPAGGRIALEARCEADRAVIRIRDNGTGIAPDILPLIFDMFVRGDGDRQGPSGLGIGLALTRRLVEVHGGTIEVASAGLGHGSEFTIRLPLDRREPTAEAPLAAEAARSSSPRRVLIVDDNADAAESLRMLLEISGHTVETAYSGAKSLAMLETFEADIVLLDIGLPDLDGYEVARRVRARHAGRTPTLVAVSGWGQAEDKRRATEAGIEAHFTKPIDPVALERLLTGTPRTGAP